MLHFFKPKQFQLRIDEPCSENWDNMLPGEKGKFCLSCSKNVIDFTTLSDQEIIKIISTSSSNGCGRLRSDQLNRTFTVQKEITIPSAFSKIAASFLLIWISETIQGSEKKTTDIETVQLSERLTIERNQTAQDTLLFLKGVVKDSTSHETIPFATIYIKDKNISTRTTISGEFELAIPIHLQGKELVIAISAVGFKPIEFNINVNDLPSGNEYFLKENAASREVIVTGNLQSKPIKQNRRNEKVTCNPSNSNRDVESIAREQKRIEDARNRKWWQFWKAY
jgi:hypothetical protein